MQTLPSPAWDPQSGPMFACPGCQARVLRTEVQRRPIWACPQCGGRIATIAHLRKNLDREVVERYWWHARRRAPAKGAQRPCPTCNLDMREVSVVDGAPPLDACKHCQLFWFDPGEFDLLPPPAPEPVPQPLAATEAESGAEAATRDASLKLHPAEPTWQYLFLLFGFPMEQTATRVRRHPWITWSLAAVIAVVSLVAFNHFMEAVGRFAFIPEHAFRTGGLTLLTAFFLHADLGHLIGNLYFLVVFGDNVEDFLGRWRYALLLVAATLAGSLLHFALEPGSPTPSIGASGGISGLIAFYALRFRRARLLVLIVFFPLRASVWVLFLLWGVLQMIGLASQLQGVSAVSASAHIGGALVGVLFWWLEEAGARRGR